MASVSHLYMTPGAGPANAHSDEATFPVNTSQEADGAPSGDGAGPGGLRENEELTKDFQEEIERQLEELRETLEVAAQDDFDRSCTALEEQRPQYQDAQAYEAARTKLDGLLESRKRHISRMLEKQRKSVIERERAIRQLSLGTDGQSAEVSAALIREQEQLLRAIQNERRESTGNQSALPTQPNRTPSRTSTNPQFQPTPSLWLPPRLDTEPARPFLGRTNSSSVTAPHLSRHGSSGSQTIAQSLFPNQSGSASQSSWLADTSANLHGEPESIVHEDDLEGDSESDGESDEDRDANGDDANSFSGSAERLFNHGSTVPAKSVPCNILQSDTRARSSSDKDRDSALHSQNMWKPSLENMRPSPASQPRTISLNQRQSQNANSRTTPYSNSTTTTATTTVQNRRVSTSRTATLGSDAMPMREAERQWNTSASASPPAWNGLSSSMSATAGVSNSSAMPIPVPPSNTVSRTSDSAGGSSSLSSSFRETHIWRPRENSKAERERDGASVSPATSRHPSSTTVAAASVAAPAYTSTPSPIATKRRPRTDSEPLINGSEGTNGSTSGPGLARQSSLKVPDSNATPSIPAALSLSPLLYERRTTEPPPLSTTAAATVTSTASLSRLPTEIIDDGSPTLDRSMRSASSRRSGEAYENGIPRRSVPVPSSTRPMSAERLLSSFDDPFDQLQQGNSRSQSNAAVGLSGDQNRDRGRWRGDSSTAKSGLSDRLALERGRQTESEQYAIYLPFSQFEPDDGGQEPPRSYSWEDEESRRWDRDRGKGKVGEKYRDRDRDWELPKDRQKENEQQGGKNRQKEIEREREREVEREKGRAREREAMERAHRRELDELSREWEDRLNSRVEELTTVLNDARRSEDLQRRRIQQLEMQQKGIEQLREEETEKLRRRINELKDQHHRQNEQLKQDLLEQARTREAEIMERHRLSIENVREQHRKRDSDLIQEQTRLEDELVELQRNLEAEILRLQNKREEDLLEQEREMENAFQERMRKRDLELAQACTEVAEEKTLREEERHSLECRLQELLAEKESEITQLRQQHVVELSKRLEDLRREQSKRDTENRRERDELQRCRHEFLKQQEAAEQQRQKDEHDKAETLRALETQRQNNDALERQREELERRWVDLQKLEEDLAQRREELNLREETLRRNEELLRRQRDDDRPRRTNGLQRDKDRGRDSPKERDRRAEEDRVDLEALRAQEIENKRAWEESQRRKEETEETQTGNRDRDEEWSNVSHSPEEIRLQEDLIRYYKARQNSSNVRNSSNAGTTPPTSFSSASGSFSGPGRAASNASSVHSNWSSSQRSSVSSASSAASDFTRASTSTSASSTWSSSPRASTTASSTGTTSNKTTTADIPKVSTGSTWKTSNTAGAGGPSPSTTANSASASSGHYAAGSNTPINEAEWQRRQEEQARKQQEQFRREHLRAEQEKATRAASAAAAAPGGREAVQRAWAAYENAWATLKERPKLFFRSMPWPVLKPPMHPDELTTNAIGTFVLSPAHSSDKSTKDRLKEQLLRWHPDRFESKWVPRVDADDKEYVRSGAGQVARALNELMARENSAFG